MNAEVLEQAVKDWVDRAMREGLRGPTVMIPDCPAELLQQFRGTVGMDPSGLPFGVLDVSSLGSDGIEEFLRAMRNRVVGFALVSPTVVGDGFPTQLLLTIYEGLRVKTITAPIEGQGDELWPGEWQEGKSIKFPGMVPEWN